MKGQVSENGWRVLPSSVLWDSQAQATSTGGVWRKLSSPPPVGWGQDGQALQQVIHQASVLPASSLFACSTKYNKVNLYKVKLPELIIHCPALSKLVENAQVSIIT